jgi:lipoprotein-releasing system permease protein
MKLTTRIAIRQLRSRHSFGFISFSTIFSIVGLAIGIASLIIISCISRGFSDIVNFKLSGIDGHIRIGSYMSDRISMSKIANLDSSI